MKLRKLIISLLLAVLLLPSMQAFAAGRIDPDKEVSLTIQFTYNGRNISGATFDLYRVADVSQWGSFTLTGDFAGYPVSLDTQKSEEWKRTAETLRDYAERDHLTPLDSGKTNSSGMLTFPQTQERLTQGMYLVVGQSLKTGGYTYTFEPFLVSLPNQEKGSRVWDYDVITKPKCTRKKDSSGGSTITRKVLKVWEDDGREEERPEEIVVQLLRDGEVYSTVTLNEANNWRHTWSSLSSKYDWTVVEKEPSGYTVKVSQEGITFVITNTIGEPDEPDEPDHPDNPDNPDHPDNPDNPDHPENPDSPGEPSHPNQPGSPDVPDIPEAPETRLPQTGMLWWPVPMLAAAGLLLILLGLLRNRSENDAE